MLKGSEGDPNSSGSVKFLTTYFVPMFSCSLIEFNVPYLWLE